MRDCYALMAMPAALVGPEMSSVENLSAIPGESMATTSTDVAFAAKTYAKLCQKTGSGDA